MNTIHFNTKRGYTKLGQRITATLKEDNTVTFHDHDRMVTGEFKLSPDIDTFNQATVMYYYDHSIAQQTQQSWQDAFMPEGCNAEYREDTHG
jgi:hypothetical protein